MDGRQIPHGLLVKEMFSTKDDETILGARVVGWGSPATCEKGKQCPGTLPIRNGWRAMYFFIHLKTENFFSFLWDGP